MEEDLVKVGTKQLDQYISGLDVEWYDISSEESTRNAKGDLRYIPINQKYKLVITTKPMTKAELTDFFSVIPMSQLSVKYFNPYTGADRTANMYRGDRKISLYWNRTDKGILYQPMQISLIEI